MTPRKLGRGLDVLIGKEETPVSSELLELSPSQIKPNPDQPRKRFSINDLEMLKASISREGLLQPILVRKVGESYQLVAGERRLRAAQDLGLEKIPAILVKVGDERMLELALIENVQREDLNPIELARAYRQLMEVKSWTQEALAQALNLSRPAISNTVRLLDLAQDIQEALVRGQITMGHAKVLLSVTEPKEQRLLFEKIAEEKLTVRDLEDVREVSESVEPEREEGKRGKRGKDSRKKPHIISLEEQLSEQLGTRVRIHEREGKGRVTIEFYSTDDFERIRSVLLGAKP
jgi:ParB family chromosome partitioning protein